MWYIVVVVVVCVCGGGGGGGSGCLRLPCAYSVVVVYSAIAVD